MIGQIAQELSVPSIVAELGLYGTIAYGLIGALLPGSPTFSKSNQEDVKKRGKGEQFLHLQLEPRLKSLAASLRISMTY